MVDRSVAPMKHLHIFLLFSLLMGLPFLTIKAQEDIVVENTNDVWTDIFEGSVSLINLEDMTPRITMQYTDATLNLNLQKILDIDLTANVAMPRIIIEYADSIINFYLEPPFPISQSASQDDTISEDESPLNQKKGEPYVYLYGHKTNVTVGEEIIAYLSVVNPISSSGTLIVQLTLQIPSGWSITSAGFSPAEGGLKTAVHEVKQGEDPQNIWVHILANQPFRGFIIGHIDYCFYGNETKHRKEVSLPVTAEPQMEEKPEPIPPKPNPPEPQSSETSLENVLSFIENNWIFVLILGAIIIAVIIALVRRGRG